MNIINSTTYEGEKIVSYLSAAIIDIWGSADLVVLWGFDKARLGTGADITRRIRSCQTGAAFAAA